MRSSSKVSGPAKMRASLELFKVANLKSWLALKLVGSGGIFVHNGNFKVAYVFLSSSFGPFGNFVKRPRAVNNSLGSERNDKFDASMHQCSYDDSRMRNAISLHLKIPRPFSQPSRDSSLQQIC